MKKGNTPYFIGLDLGTDSVGYAATTEQYELMKFRGRLMWGVHHFEEALLNGERRSFRIARRRLDRRQQRVKLVQELFAREVGKIDEQFFLRIKESALYDEDTTCGSHLFGSGSADKDYYKKYPTIHHLISELIHDPNPHDVRLVYLAVAWLVAHRGHFLNEISRDNIAGVLDIGNVYSEFVAFFEEDVPWRCDDPVAFGEILKKKTGITAKYRELCVLLFGTPKAPKQFDGACHPDALLKLLCGSKVSPKQLFCKEEYAEVDGFTLDKGDDELAPILSALGDDAELVLRAKALYDWAILSNTLQGKRYLSDAKVLTYNRHKEDLSALKYVIRKYLPKKYSMMFRHNGKPNYVAYSGHHKGNRTDRSNEKTAKHEEFCDFTRKLLKEIDPLASDVSLLKDMMTRLENYTFCPKQVNSENRVIPYQVYWVEMKEILERAEAYLPFLKEVSDGSSVSQKLMSVFAFRVPYYVGPLNSASDRAWLVRRAEGKIYPWNFDRMVDEEASEREFIDRMTNTCTYIPGADVLPKMSLCYERFELLNELNAISVNGRRIPVEAKQKLFSELCMNRKRVTKKIIKDFLRANNYYTAEELLTIGGIDDTVKSALNSHMALRNFLESGKLTHEDAENIIRQRTYTESKHRFALWMEREYPDLSQKDRNYICTLKCKDFGRLSGELLGMYGTEAESQTGEAFTILERMWNENVLLMELLSDKYTYGKQIEEIRGEYYRNNPKTLDDRLSEMYVSNSVKRSILRALDVVSDVVKANGGAPEKIFVEMARGGKPEDKGKRTQSRYDQIMERYKKCKTGEVRELSESLAKLGDPGKLQSDRLFLYYMQLGRCMYTGEPIDIQRLSDKIYDIDHIYPQSKVKDDSVLNNKVLVLSTANGSKGDTYPVRAEIRNAMQPYWKSLMDSNLITEEKYKRLTRCTPFSESEQWGFINRQLVETRQSTKVLATILGELYPETKVVYVKAGLVSEFRQEFDMLKSRAVNDLHHAKDAYLNIVVGNVYNERFTKQWFMTRREDYNLKVKTLFSHPVKCADGKTVWQGDRDVGRIKDLVHNKNAVNQTRYAICRKGGFFDQQPKKAAEGLVPLKQGLPTEKYGGYNKTRASFFMLAKYDIEKKTDLMLMPVELLHAQRLSDENFAKDYAKETIGSILGKNVLSVSFPLGMRKIRIGTVFEFDRSFRAYLTGKSNGGRIVLMSTFCPLTIGYPWEKYIKRIERFVERKKENPNMVYSERYDEVTTQKNLELYDILAEKLQTPVYKKRPGNPWQTLVSNRDKFEELDIFEQSECIRQILLVFSRMNDGCDLTAVGGAAKAAVLTLNASISNWKKNYQDVRIVDMSASGLYQRRARENLMELV